ncbi:MAG: 3-hydroxyacyl-CoA dehydrogenase family protein [Anaerolineae bacterium]
MEVKNIAVIGAGVMGSQIAQVAAQAGFEVRMRDISDELVQRALDGIRGSLKRFFVDKGKMTAEEAEEIMGHIQGTTDLAAAVKEADLAIESIPENMALKKEMFQDLSDLCRAETILASNTSALSITDIASASTRPERVIGMHFFNPVAVMKLVEIVRGAKTDEETVATVKEVAEKRLGKETVVINDSPGFITSRMVDVIINEAACMLEEGVASAEEIDKAIKLGLGHPMGPLELADFTNGVAIAMEGMTYLQQEFGDPKYRPSYLLKQMVRAGHLGRKVGRGFYEYST